MPAILTDNFNDNSIDPAKWDVGAIADQNLSVTVVEAGGQLVITPLTSTPSSNRNGLSSDSTFNMTQGYAVWRLEQKAGANASVVTRCGVVLDANNWLGFEIANTILTFRKRASSTDSNTTTTYNSTNHKYLMLVHCGGAVAWFTSANGIDWAMNRSAVVPGFAVTAVKQFMDAGTTASVATITPTTSIFDDVEIGTLELEAPFEQVAGIDGTIIVREATPGNPFTIPMSRKYIGNRIVAAQTLHRYHSLVTSELLSSVDFILTSPNAGSTAIIFNVKIDGVPLWAGGARPSIAPGATRATKTNVAVSLTRAVSLIEIVVESVPTIGVPAPITSQLDAVVS